MSVVSDKLRIEYVPVSSLRHAEYNPRVVNDETKAPVRASLEKHGAVDPLVVNNAPGREGVIIGGNLRFEVMKDLGWDDVPVVYVTIPDLEREKDLCLRLNKSVGEWDYDLLAQFDESFLEDVGFDSEELDEIFEDDPAEEQFNLEEALEKIGISEITTAKGDLYDLDGSRLYVGDSTVEADMLALMGDERADMCLTDMPFRLQYLKGKTRHGESTTGFGAKKNRRYLETESLPPDFVEKWMGNVAKVAAKNFSIISYENWRNIRERWGEMEKHWKVRNMIVWHLPNRNQGYAGKHKFFSKHDIAMVGTSEEHPGLDLSPEGDLLEEEYRTALFAISGKPHWEAYGKGKRYCPTDFIEFNAADEKSSGQGVIFGVKPLEILIPYIKILTRRGQLVLEPFGGSGSTLIASITLGRRCYIMEKSPVYAEVILNRWEKRTGKKRVKLHGAQ
ncbi:MAG: DNA modification methylase [Patescibacteria group bacterium]|nr:DNA modification methylase [Patescibacteria group bacterium]MDE2057914.1 DNA modification methylase [Patescibacteria group bacterium]